jgi:hypothetical protein
VNDKMAKNKDNNQTEAERIYAEFLELLQEREKEKEQEKKRKQKKIKDKKRSYNHIKK